MPGYADLFVGGIKPGQSTALENSHRIAVGTGALTTLSVLNFDTTARLILLFDTASATQPTNGAGATPVYFFPIAAGTSNGPAQGLGFDWTIPPLQFTNGLWIVVSSTITTPFTLTAVTTNQCCFVWQINQA